MKRVIMVGIGLLMLSSLLIAGNAEQLWNFDQETGPIPAGFTSEKGEWKIVADPTAPSPPCNGSERGSFRPGSSDF